MSAKILSTAIIAGLLLAASAPAFAADAPKTKADCEKTKGMKWDDATKAVKFAIGPRCARLRNQQQWR